MASNPSARKPQLSFWQIWNMCFGFLGIQFGFALQNANVSRIFQTLGAEMDSLPGLWIAAPLTGLVVQPIIGYLSDRTWTGLGRRRPYFLVGAVLSSIALLFMPDSPTLWIAAGLLWVLDASINISMEPFRAFVGDQLPVSQRAKGYAMQSFFIGIGSVIASMLPWMLEKWGVANTADAGQVPDTVRYAFYAGAGVLLKEADFFDMACCSVRSRGRCCAPANTRPTPCTPTTKPHRSIAPRCSSRAPPASACCGSASARWGWRWSRCRACRASCTCSAPCSPPTASPCWR